MTKQELLDELTRLQNIVALEELKKHYDKSESYRVLDDLNYEPTEAFKKAQQLLDEEYTGCVKAKINKLGTITITEECENTLLNAKVERVIGTIFPSVELPYGYVMGKKIGKKVAQKILEQYGMSL